jgi:hypothetical protein
MSAPLSLALVAAELRQNQEALQLAEEAHPFRQWLHRPLEALKRDQEP